MKNNKLLWILVISMFLFQFVGIVHADSQITISLGVEETVTYPWAGLNTWYPWLFDRLVERNEQLATERPNLAKDWEISEDYKVITFYLRDDVKWHDGEEFTAQDVKTSVEYGVLPDSRPHWSTGAGLRVIKGTEEYIDGEADHIEGINIVDDYTIRFELSEPDAMFFTIFGGYDILPHHLISKISPDEFVGSEFFKEPVGTGPYILEDFEPQQYIEFKANKEYHRGTPQIETVMVRDFEQPEIAANKGILDFAGAFTVEAAREVESLSDYETITVQTPRTQFFEVNTDRIPDPRVREAMLLSIDREQIIESLYDGEAVTTRSDLIPAGSFWENKDLPVIEYNPDKAEDLLEEADWDQDEEIEIVYYYADETTKSIMEAIQFFFSRVGIESELRYVEGAVLWDVMDKRDFHLRYVGANFVDPSTLENYLTDAYDNRSGYSNPEVDELLIEGRQYIDSEKRKENYDKIQQIISEDLPGIPLWTPNSFILKSNRLKLPEGVMPKGCTSHDMRVHLWEIEE